MKFPSCAHLVATCLAGHGLVCSTASVNVSEAATQIDAMLSEEWKQHQLTPNPPANDETFVRRVYLDMVGRIPTLQEARAFLDSRALDKRAVLIDRLLASEGHAQHMFQFWADLLRVQSRANGGQGEMTSKPYLEHVKKRIRE